MNDELRREETSRVGGAEPALESRAAEAANKTTAAIGRKRLILRSPLLVDSVKRKRQGASRTAGNPAWSNDVQSLFDY